MNRYVVRDAPRERWGWLLDKVGLLVTPAFKAIEAVDRSGETRGMVGYDLWTNNSVQLHCAVEHPAAWLALLYPGLQYPFEQAFGRGVELCMATVRDDNQSVKKFLCKLGWVMAHRVREAAEADVDLLVFEMRRADWYRLLADHDTGPLLRGRRLGRQEERRTA